MRAPADLDRDTSAQIDAWAASGAMALTTTPSGRWCGPPVGLVPKMQVLAGVLAARTAALGHRVEVDPLALLTERAAIAGLPLGGTVSCGGGARLLCTDGRWWAVSLARPDDLDLVPAWLGLAGPPDDPWGAVEHAATQRPLHELLDQARLLGLPHGLLPDDPVGPSPFEPLDRHPLGPAVAPTAELRGVVVIDLTALWAGPLCGALLAEAGATVIKVESTHRPDGARRGPPAFFDRLNRAKQGVTVDLRTAEGVATLSRLLAEADVVLEASRPRALEQLGLHAAQLIADGRTRVWVSITGHGREGPQRDRVGFGDDAAVAGGLVTWAEDRPLFCADAIADPATGLAAAAAVLDALATGGRWLLDVSLAGVARHLAGPTLPLDGWTGTPAPPRPPVSRRR